MTYDYAGLERDARVKERELLIFLEGKRVPCGQLEGWYKIWAGVERTPLHIRWETDKHQDSGNGTIPLDVIRYALGLVGPPTLFVHYSGWKVATPEAVASARPRWFCCPVHARAFKAREPIPDLCPSLVDDRPYLGYPLTVYKSRIDLYLAKRPVGAPSFHHPLFEEA